MFNLFAALLAASGIVGAQAAPAASTATSARPLSSIPGIQINYYDVAGADNETIGKSINAILRAPAPNNAAKIYDWSVSASTTNQQAGTVCTIKAAKINLTAMAWLPRLQDQAKVPADVLAQWNTYAAGVEKTASDNLWFVADRIPAIEQSLVGKPCADGNAALKAALNQLKDDQTAFAKAHSAAPKRR